jgi:hypothetical protein
MCVICHQRVGDMGNDMSMRYNLLFLFFFNTSHCFCFFTHPIASEFLDSMTNAPAFPRTRPRLGLRKMPDFCNC